jgi:NAD-dependent SIR2 family protein deacetylase
MSRIVFILGAGASQQAGVPLMGNFLDVAYELGRSAIEKRAESPFTSVFEAIESLQTVFAKSYLDLTNLETVFGAFEMAKLLGRLGNLPTSKVEQLPTQMRRVILDTVQETTQFLFSDKQFIPPRPYSEFVSLLNSCEDQRLSTAVLTFNYDLGLDYAFHSHMKEVTYGLSNEQSKNGFPLLKLHGSINWAACSKCNAVIPWKLDSFFSTHHWNAWQSPKTGKLNIAKYFPELKHCENESVHSDPVIVPPTWNKSQYHSAIGEVWRKAAEELESAEDIFICGYSLPNSDHFFHHLFAIATASPARLRRIWVFNPDSTDTVRPRFEALLGAGVQKRFLFHKSTFENAIKIISKEMLTSS